MQQHKTRAISAQIDVDAGISTVWSAWTTEEGVRGFFGPECKIDFRVGGDYEVYFYPGEEPGNRGAEGTEILMIQPEKSFSFTWNNPPYLPSVQWQYTSVHVQLERLSDKRTRVRLSHTGWGDGDDWDRAYEFFDRGWKNQVLPYLKRFLEDRPINWHDPPEIGR